MAISALKMGYLLMAWAFFAGLVGVALTIPTLLMIIGSVLYLVG